MTSRRGRQWVGVELAHGELFELESSDENDCERHSRPVWSKLIIEELCSERVNDLREEQYPPSSDSQFEPPSSCVLRCVILLLRLLEKPESESEDNSDMLGLLLELL